MLALSGLVLRRDWLRTQMRERQIPDAASELNRLCESAEALVESSREALVAFVALLVSENDVAWLDELRRSAHEAGYSSLERIQRGYPVPSAHELEQADLHNPALGRDLTVGERRSLARAPHRGKFDRLLLDPHPLVLRQLLGNPKLTENDVVKLAARRPARASSLNTLVEFPDWIVRTRVRMTLISNPMTPSRIAVPLTALATRPELAEIAENPSLHVVLRVLAQELLDRHPPLGPAVTATLQ
jgi:hypothetical protein